LSCFTEKVYFDEACFEPCPPTGGGGGAVPTYKDETEPSCNIKIKKVYFDKVHY